MEALKFIKNIVEVDVDGLHGINHYTIKAMYDERHEDERGEWWDITHKIIDQFDYTWDEIDRDGGIAKVNADIKEFYGVEM